MQIIVTASAQRRCGEGRYAEEARHGAVMSSHGFLTAQFVEERAASAAADAARKQTRSRDIRVLNHGRALLCTDKACSFQGKSNGNAVPAVRKISHPPRPERVVEQMRHAYSILQPTQSLLSQKREPPRPASATSVELLEEFTV